MSLTLLPKAAVAIEAMSQEISCYLQIISIWCLFSILNTLLQDFNEKENSELPVFWMWQPF